MEVVSMDLKKCNLPKPLAQDISERKLTRHSWDNSLMMMMILIHTCIYKVWSWNVVGAPYCICPHQFIHTIHEIGQFTTDGLH